MTLRLNACWDVKLYYTAIQLNIYRLTNISEDGMTSERWYKASHIPPDFPQTVQCTQQNAGVLNARTNDARVTIRSVSISSLANLWRLTFPVGESNVPKLCFITSAIQRRARLRHDQLLEVNPFQTRLHEWVDRKSHRLSPIGYLRTSHQALSISSADSDLSSCDNEPEICVNRVGIAYHTWRVISKGSVRHFPWVSAGCPEALATVQPGMIHKHWS